MCLETDGLQPSAIATSRQTLWEIYLFPELLQFGNADKRCPCTLEMRCKHADIIGDITFVWTKINYIWFPCCFLAIRIRSWSPAASHAVDLIWESLVPGSSQFSVATNHEASTIIFTRQYMVDNKKRILIRTTIKHRNETETWQLAHTKQAYKKQIFYAKHYHINFWSSVSSSGATFCTARYSRLLVVLYFSFIINLLFLLQSVSRTAQPKYNTQSVATMTTVEYWQWSKFSEEANNYCTASRTKRSTKLRQLGDDGLLWSLWHLGAQLTHTGHRVGRQTPQTKPLRLNRFF